MVDSAVSLQDRWNLKATEPHWRNEDTSTLSRHQKKPWTPTQSLYVFQMEYLSFDLGAWYCRHLPTIYLRTSKVHVDFVTSCNILLWSLVTVYPSLSVYLTLTSFERKSPRFAQKKRSTWSTSVSEAGDHRKWRPQQWVTCQVTPFWDDSRRFTRWCPSGNISGWWLTYPSEKYENQLGWWHSQDMESHKIPWFQTTNQSWYFMVLGQFVEDVIAPIAPSEGRYMIHQTRTW